MSPQSPHSATTDVRLDFIVPGFSKCGTTTLCALLGTHPGVFVPSTKDFQFYDLAEPQVERENYDARFSSLLEGSRVGDGSVWCTDASFEVRARDNLLEQHPDIKLIFMARDPIERIESAFRESHHNRMGLRNPCPFDLADAIGSLTGISLDTRYGDRLANYVERVDESRMLLLTLEELVQSPQTVLERCFRFLGVAPNFVVPNADRRLNARSEKYQDTPRFRELQNDPEYAALVDSVHFFFRQQFLPQLGLRKPFGDAPLDWDHRARDRFLQLIGANPLSYLDAAGLDAGIWPRYRAMLDG